MRKDSHLAAYVEEAVEDYATEVDPDELKYPDRASLSLLRADLEMVVGGEVTGCRCPEGFPKRRTSYYQSLEGRRGGTTYTGWVPIVVRYLGHTGKCPLADEVLSVRRQK